MQSQRLSNDTPVDVSDNTKIMALTTETKSIQNHQPPLALFVRVMDSLAIGLALYMTTQLLGVEWSRIHSFYAMVGILMMQFFSEFLNLYTNWKLGKSVLLAAQAVGVWLCTCLFMLVFALLFDQNLAGLYLTLATTWVAISCVNLSIVRLLLNQLIVYLRKHGKNVKRVAIAGAGPLANYAQIQLNNDPWTGYDIVGIYDDRGETEYKLGQTVNNKRKVDYIKGVSNDRQKLLGRFPDMYKAARSGEFDVVFITLPMRAESKIYEILHHLSATTAAAYIVPDFYSIDSHYSQLKNVNGMPAVSIYENPVSGLKGVVKRLEDIILSTMILLLIGIPMLLIACLIKLTSKGPAIFKQTRYGLDGKPIKVWKFRSMNVMQDSGKIVQATKNDPRVTPLGKFLRRTSLDELPQFLNVLAGDMSIVGPRPHAVDHNEEYRDIIEGYMLRHKARPGITGWAQVNGFRGETDTLDKMKGRVDYDIEYIRNWSVLFDIKIVFLTLFNGFRSNNAY